MKIYNVPQIKKNTHFNWDDRKQDFVISVTALRKRISISTKRNALELTKGVRYNKNCFKTYFSGERQT